jgi:TolA-binding protein
MPVLTSIRQLAVVMVFSTVLLGQSSTGSGTGTPGAPLPTQSATRQPSTQTNDDLAQMRNDLNKMESLNMNMSSEIEFLHDQNLQILLRTNSQMWTILIRDLRRQIQLEEQHKSVASPTTSR